MKIVCNGGFFHISLFYIFSQITDIVSSTFSTILVDNQVDRDQIIPDYRPKKVKKKSILQTHFEESVTFGGVLRLCGTF